MIWSKTMGPTALSALTDVLIGGANLKLPAEAKSILAIIPHMVSVAGLTATEAQMAKVKLMSNDFKINPYEVLCVPVGSTLGAKGEHVPKQEAPVYPVNCPVKGGSELSIYGIGLIDHTIEPYVMVTVIIGDFDTKDGKPLVQFWAKCGTLTTMGAATAGETKGSGIRLTGCKAIKEVNGFQVGTTVASLKGFIGKFRLSSAGFLGMGDVEFGAEPIGGLTAIDATTACLVENAKLTRIEDLDIPVTDPIDIDDYYNLGVAVTTAGKFIVGVIFV